jgi:hypothetical protein
VWINARSVSEIHVNPTAKVIAGGGVSRNYDVEGWLNMHIVDKIPTDATFPFFQLTRNKTSIWRSSLGKPLQERRM